MYVGLSALCTACGALAVNAAICEARYMWLTHQSDQQAEMSSIALPVTLVLRWLCWCWWWRQQVLIQVVVVPLVVLAALVVLVWRRVERPWCPAAATSVDQCDPCGINTCISDRTTDATKSHRLTHGYPKT